MAKSMKSMVLLAKAQPTAGTDPIPTGTADAFMVRALTPKPISAEFVERTALRGYKGNFGQLAVGVHREFEFEVELASSGAAGTAPKLGLLLKACGMSETIVATTSVAYGLVSSGEPMLTLYGYLDGILWKMLDSKGTVSFDVNAKNIPVAKFKFVGAYSVATDTPLPTTDYTAFKQPLTVGKVNTPTFSFFGVPAITSALSFDIANALVWRDLINGSGAFSGDRKPVGSITMEVTPIATKDWSELVRLGTTGVLQLVHGSTAGSIVQIDCPALQLTSEPSLSDDNGAAMQALSFSMLPVNGNDEFVLTFK